MNKTININLGGIFFHIDEEAYSILKIYLDAIRKSLSDDAQGKDEIITDIEIRIGEILSERIKDIRQVVNKQDIEDIITVMGKPEEYAGDEEYFEDGTSFKKARSSRKLFRDTEDKFLGGVSSGLSHYSGIDVIWIRLTWLLLLISGFSVILYPILWILLPQANSTSDKLEMEGFDVNISNIERKIKEELSKATNFVKDGIDDASTNLKNGDYQNKMRSGLQEIIDLIAKVFSAIFKIARKFIGIILIVISVLTLLSILVGGFSLGSISFLGLTDELTNYPLFFHTSRIPLFMLTSFAFVAVGIPFVLLFKLGLKIISTNVNKFTRTTNLSLLGVWLLSIMALIFAGIEHGAHSSNKFSTSKKHVIAHQALDTLNIKFIVKDDFKPRKTEEVLMIVDKGITKAYKTNIQFDIRESNTNEMYLRIYKKAKAISINDAKFFADEIEYEFKIMDNNLILNGYFLSDIKQQYQSQYIRMTLFVPNGKTIYFDRSTKYFLNDIDNIQNIYETKMIKHHFKMTNDGLDCLDCKNQKSKKVVKEKGGTGMTKSESISDTKKENEITNPEKDAELIHKEIKKKLNKNNN